MKLNKRATCFILAANLSLIAFSNVWGACFIVDSKGNQTPYDGKTLAGLQVEKKSLILLDKTYPNLNIIEKTFTGEVQTCGVCTETFIRCSKD